MNINDLIYVKCLIQCLAHSKNSILVGTIITILYHHVIYVISFPTWVSITFKYNLLISKLNKYLCAFLMRSLILSLEFFPDIPHLPYGLSKNTGVY